MAAKRLAISSHFCLRVASMRSHSAFRGTSAVLCAGVKFTHKGLAGTGWAAGFAAGAMGATTAGAGVWAAAARLRAQARAAAMVRKAATLLTTLRQVLVETMVEISRQGQLVRQHGGVQLGQFGDAALFLVLVDAGQAGHQGQQGDDGAGAAYGREGKEGADVAGKAGARLALGGLDGDVGFLAGHGGLACGGQAVRRRRRQVLKLFVERVAHFVREIDVFGVHNVSPLAFSASARVWVAREQCVLTLPSEHPIASAVSATSMSCQ